jgi:Fe2+ transport system protein FeoA
MAALALLRTASVRVFVASGWIERAGAAEVMRQLRALGCTITHDWTVPQSTDPARTAALDLAGVRAAEVVVAVMAHPSYEYKGTFTEIGIALGARIPVLLVSPFKDGNQAVCARNVYFHSAELERCESVEALLAALRV